MINIHYRLQSPKRIGIDLVDELETDETVIVRPLYLSICAADERYWQGKRDAKVLAQKLPMSLIHEAVGIVVKDRKNEFKVGTKVVMIPNTPTTQDDIIKENYLRSSKFRGSGYDGFMQNVVFINRNRLIPYKNINDRVAVLSELISVGMNALDHFEKYSHARKDSIGIWGDGNVGYITALILRKFYPKAKIIVFGANQDKLQYFQFVDETYLVNEVPEALLIDHAFECVGGTGSQNAIAQIIDHINPQGSISLMGVSENPIDINTRMVLEKGLTLLGNSRSSYEDFAKTIKFLEDYPETKAYLERIISEEIVVKSIGDMSSAFEKDVTTKFKTIMKWDI